MPNLPFHEYCGAQPPPPQDRARNCLKIRGHSGKHRNMELFEWGSEPAHQEE